LGVSACASEAQSFLSSFLAAKSPVFALAVPAGALIIAVSLSGALNLEEISALSIGATADVAKLKEFPHEYAVQ
jgi:hypothetical protein